MRDVSTSRPRVLFLNRSYWPCAEATGQLLTELCEDLSSQFDITVLAGQPNENPDGHAFEARGSQDHRGVRIRRVWNSRFPKSSLAGKSCNLLSYLFGALLASVRVPRPDVVVVETDPPLLCLLGALLRWRHRCRLVVYLQDIYPDVAVAIGKLPAGWPTTWLRRLFFRVYRTADRVVVLSEDMSKLLASEGIEPARIVTIPNWVDTRQVHPIKQDNPFRARHGLGERFVVMYSGNLGLCQRLDDVLQAAEQLRDRADIRWLFVGGGASRERLEATAKAERLENVQFLPYQPKDELAASLSGADLHVVSIDPRVINYLMPSKLYGVLASGTALLCVAPSDCELARITREAEVGVVVEPGMPKALADAVLHWSSRRAELEAMGWRGWQLAQSAYDRPKQTAAFGRMLSELLGPAAAPREGETFASPPISSPRTLQESNP